MGLVTLLEHKVAGLRGVICDFRTLQPYPDLGNGYQFLVPKNWVTER